MRSFLLFLVALLPAIIAKPVSDFQMIDEAWDSPASVVDTEHDSPVSEIDFGDNLRPFNPSDAQNQIANAADVNTGFTPEKSGDGVLDSNSFPTDLPAQANAIQGQRQCGLNDPTTVNKRASSEESNDSCAKPNPFIKGAHGEERQCIRGTKTVCCTKAQISPSGEFWIGMSCYPCMLTIVSSVPDHAILHFSSSIIEFPIER